MNTILVPTDFSDTARKAFLYAQELASFLTWSLKVVHVHHPSADPSAFYNTSLGASDVKIKQEKLQRFIEQNVSSSGAAAKIDSELVLGFAADELVNMSNQEGIDLLVMGMTGAGGLLEKTFGSISSHVSRKSGCPVLLVPIHVQFAGIRNIAYTSQYESADDQLFDRILNFARVFEAAIHLVHVNSEKETGDRILENLVLKNTFEEKAPELSYKLVHIEDDTVWEGLNNYVTETSIDMVVMVTRQRSFWENVLHKSTTKKVVEQATFPVMVLHVK